MRQSTALKLIVDEVDRATKQHESMSSAHEGYAVILEEVDELWDEIKANRGTTDRGTSEAVQVAAMALRYLIDLCDEETSVKHEEKVARHYESVPDGGWGSRGGYSG